MLTQEGLKKLLHYNPELGVFIWLAPKRRVTVGEIAGSKNKCGPTNIMIEGKMYKAHRLAWFYMTGEWPKRCIDHVNGNPKDNRWKNLRGATHTQNMRNRKIGENNSSQFKGVYLPKGKTKWVARVHHEGKTKHLGCFDCEHEAALAYNQYVMDYHGQYARFNQVYNHFDVEVGRDD